jgi:hypothetical protein
VGKKRFDGFFGSRIVGLYYGGGAHWEWIEKGIFGVLSYVLPDFKTFFLAFFYLLFTLR